MASTPYAHTLAGKPESDWHPLERHLQDSALLAEHFASTFSAGEWGRLAGLWHDLGKFSDAFQAYLRASGGTGEGLHATEMSGRVDHSTAGAQHAVQKGPLGRLLAYCIAGHHAGLPDNEGGEPGLSARLRKQIEPFGATPKRLLDLNLPTPPRLKLPAEASSQRRGFTLAFFTRMVFSCLVDADFLDAERFMDRGRAALRPSDHVSCADLLARLNGHLDDKQRQALNTHVNRIRRDVLKACRDAAPLAPGFFSLNVPTGGGKTLSSLAFALAHAAKHGLARVVYAIPFTSTIEQTSDVFREALSDLRA